MIELLKSLADFILHIDKHLLQIVADYNNWTYLILALIVFCETGLVVTPLLPGDSLLFAAGTIAAQGLLNLPLLILILFIAAFTGDNTNYFIGKFLGPKVFEKNYRLLKRKYLTQTHAFYEKHGGKTIIIARFMPIIRTFAPFVAGVGTMKYTRFISFSILGNVLWIVSFSVMGFYFGNIPAIKKNFTLVIFAIILLSLTPPVIAYLRHKLITRK
jgi:membrane-associated protein